MDISLILLSFMMMEGPTIQAFAGASGCLLGCATVITGSSMFIVAYLIRRLKQKK